MDEEEANNDTEDDDQEDGVEEDGEDIYKEGGEEEDEGNENAEEEGDEDEAVEIERETEDGIILSYDILNITAPCHRDESVSHVEIHAHQPQASSSLNNNDEIRISVQAQDLKVLPRKSSLVKKSYGSHI